MVPSVPGFPGAEGHDLLDTQLDWILAAQDLLEAAGLAGADLVGSSVGAALAADAAACRPGLARRLVLIGPLGVFDEAEPVADLWAQRPGDLPRMVCVDPEHFQAAVSAPEGEDPVEAEVLLLRAHEAAARLLWPLSDTGLAKRLPRIRAPGQAAVGGRGPGGSVRLRPPLRGRARRREPYRACPRGWPPRGARRPGRGRTPGPRLSRSVADCALVYRSVPRSRAIRWPFVGICPFVRRHWTQATKGSGRL